MAVAGPERSGSGTGVPVPRSTTFVRAGRSFGAWLFGSCGFASITDNIRKDSNTERMTFMESSISWGDDAPQYTPAAHAVPRGTFWLESRVKVDRVHDQSCGLSGFRPNHEQL